MKFIVYSLLFLALFSCANPKTEELSKIVFAENKIPKIEYNKSDADFDLKNGVLFYKNKLYSGTVNEYYSEGQLKSVSEYFEGKREGKYFGFYPNQKKWFERYYSKGLKVNTHRAWFLNEQQMFEYQFNNQGVYNGYTKDWHSNGQLAKYFNFKKGVEAGSQQMWKVTGKIRANFYTVNGERHGLIGLKNCVSVVSVKNE